MALNNRELAILLWLAVVLLISLIWILPQSERRASVPDLVRPLITPTVLTPFALMLGYVGLMVWLAAQTPLWDAGLTKETVIWTATAGVALFFKFDDASKKPHFFRNRLGAAVGVAVFIEVFMNLFVLSFLGELVLQPVLFVLVVIASVAPLLARREPDRHADHHRVGKLLEAIVSIIGFSFLIFSLHQLYSNWNDIDKGNVVQQLALPVWLSAGLLPYIYALGLYSNYELAFKGINWGAENSPRARLWAKLAVLVVCHLRARESGAFSFLQASQLGHASSFRDALQRARHVQQSRRDAEQAVVDERERLERYAGSDETDGHGGRLDRREFKETTAALRWLATCQMGWYQNQGEHYHEDLLERIGHDFTRQGLTQPSGIAMRVADHGQAWYAWRRTVSGWCFAIGAAEPPPNQWEYDGPEPPSGFPGEHPCWGSEAFSSEVGPNWHGL